MAASSKNLRKNEREKARRNEINEQFQRLSEVLGTPAVGQIPRREKQNLLATACRTITDLRNQRQQLLSWHSALANPSANPTLALSLQHLLPSAAAANQTRNDEDRSAPQQDEKELEQTPHQLPLNSPARLGLSLSLSPPNPFTLDGPWSSEDAMGSISHPFALSSAQASIISSGQETEAKVDPEQSENMTQEQTLEPSPRSSSIPQTQGRKRKRERSESSSHGE